MPISVPNARYGRPVIESAEEFVRLRESEYPEEYNRAGREPADLSVWMDVIDRFPDMREWVAYNKSVPQQILDLLATDADDRVRVTVAGKRRLRPETMLQMTRDPDEHVRATLMSNPKVTPEVLAILTTDPSPWIRHQIARRAAEAAGLPFEEEEEEDDGGETYEPPPVTTAEPVPAAEAARLLQAWAARWPGIRLVGHQLRHQLPDHWVRFRSRPGSRRHPDTATDVHELLDRHRRVLDRLAEGDDSPLLVMTASFSSADEPVFERSEALTTMLPDARYWISPERIEPGEPSVRTNLFVNRLTVDDGALQDLLRYVAGDQTLDVVICDPGFRWLYAPYDGGADVIAPTPAQRDELRSEFADWLPTGPSGL